MKNKDNSFNRISRRKFLGTATIAATGTLFPSVLSYGSNSKAVSKTDNASDRIPNSKFAGVQIGVITYSFRDLKGGLEAILNACVEAGLSSIELMGTGVEEYLGAPVNPVPRRRDPNNPFTDEEKHTIAQYNSELKEWRKINGTIDTYRQLS